MTITKKPNMIGSLYEEGWRSSPVASIACIASHGQSSNMITTNVAINELPVAKTSARCEGEVDQEGQGKARAKPVRE